jgi:hypothetical protein
MDRPDDESALKQMRNPNTVFGYITNLTPISPLSRKIGELLTRSLRINPASARRRNAAADFGFPTVVVQGAYGNKVFERFK